MAAPAATTWLNYKGDRTVGVVGQVMGPNLMSEYLTVVTADYNHTTDETRLGLAYGVRDLGAVS